MSAGSVKPVQENAENHQYWHYLIFSLYFMMILYYGENQAVMLLGVVENEYRVSKVFTSRNTQKAEKQQTRKLKR